MQQISDLFTAPEGLTASEAARRAGVARSTLHRIANGDVDPSLQTLHELAILHGLSLSLVLEPLSDPDAATAARVLLDPEFEGVQVSENVNEWVARLRRQSEDPIRTLVSAGHASSLLHRKDAIMLKGDHSAIRLASAGETSKREWAVSGRAAIDAPSGPSVLWAANPKAAFAAMQETHRRVSSPSLANVIIAHADPSLFTDSYLQRAVRYVAPTQMLLDCVGLGGVLEREAISIAEEWSR